MPITTTYIAIALLVVTLLVFVFPDLWKRYVRIIDAERFLIVVNIALAAWIVLGTLIIQHLSREQYEAMYGKALTDILLFLEFDTIFHSKIFVFTLTCSGISSLAKFLEALRRPRQLGTLSWAALLSHLGIIVILLGTLVSSLGAFTGFMELQEGQAKRHFLQMTKNNPTLGKVDNFELRELPFVVALEDFQIGYYEEKSRYRLSWYERDAPTGLYRFRKAWGQNALEKGVHLEALSLEVKKERESPPESEQFFISSGSGNNRKSASIVLPHNPTPNSSKEEEHILFNDGLIAVVLEAVEPQIREYRSVVNIVDKNGHEHKKLIMVNHPAVQDGYWLHQFSYRKGDETSTLLQIVYDPGWKIVLAGMVLLALGITASCLFALLQAERKRRREQ